MVERSGWDLAPEAAHYPPESNTVPPAPWY